MKSHYFIFYFSKFPADATQNTSTSSTAVTLYWLISWGRPAYPPPHSGCPGRGTAWLPGSTWPRMKRWCLGSWRASCCRCQPSRGRPRAALQPPEHNDTISPSVAQLIFIFIDPQGGGQFESKSRLLPRCRFNTYKEFVLYWIIALYWNELLNV